MMTAVIQTLLLFLVICFPGSGEREKNQINIRVNLVGYLLMNRKLPSYSHMPGWVRSSTLLTRVRGK